MAADAIAGDTEEYFADAQIPVVYMTLPADAIDEIPTILAANSIREVGPSVLVQRMRANKLADDPLRQELAADFAENDDSGTASSLARSIRSQTELPAENSSLDLQQRRDQPGAQRATILLEGSPEKLELAWKQMSQYKNVHLVQQAGRQLQGLKYDSNAFRGQVLAEEEALAGKSPGGGFGGKAAPEVATAAVVTKNGAVYADKATARGVATAATRKRKNESSPIVIQLIIQVTE